MQKWVQKPLNGVFVPRSQHKVPKVHPQHPHRSGAPVSPPSPSGYSPASPTSLHKLFPAPELLFCLCCLLPLTAGPSLAAPGSEGHPIIPLAPHVLPSSRAISAISLSLVPPRAGSLPPLLLPQPGSVPSHGDSGNTRAGRDASSHPSASLCREGNLLAGATVTWPVRQQGPNTRVWQLHSPALPHSSWPARLLKSSVLTALGLGWRGRHPHHAVGAPVLEIGICSLSREIQNTPLVGTSTLSRSQVTRQQKRRDQQ